MRYKVHEYCGPTVVFDNWFDAEDYITDSVANMLDEDDDYMQCIHSYDLLRREYPYQVETYMRPFDKIMDSITELYYSYFTIEEC